mmetsp:Transcript_43449/g.114550  ORF Transcript_43449/g.114550 Transcript_43449/m.114550 type:complete len:224 (-) Transcript_43449:1103-1774(-)
MPRELPATRVVTAQRFLFPEKCASAHVLQYLRQPLPCSISVSLDLHLNEGRHDTSPPGQCLQPPHTGKLLKQNSAIRMCLENEDVLNAEVLSKSDVVAQDLLQKDGRGVAITEARKQSDGCFLRHGDQFLHRPRHLVGQRHTKLQSPNSGAHITACFCPGSALNAVDVELLLEIHLHWPVVTNSLQSDLDRVQPRVRQMCSELLRLDLGRNFSCRQGFRSCEE